LRDPPPAPADAEAAPRVTVFTERLVRSSTAEAAGVHARLRAAAERSASIHVEGAGRSGVAPVEAVDRGLVLPGGLVAGPDRRLLAGGGLGAFVEALDPEACARVIAEGVATVVVPESVRVVVVGDPGRWVSGFDVAARVLTSLDPALVRGRVLELSGPVVDRMDAVERLAFAQCAAYVDVRAILVACDERALQFLRARAVRPPPPVLSDRDAAFAAAEKVDVTGLEPMVFPADRIEEATALSELPEVAVDQVVLGGHAGGRVEDLRIAARLLKEHPVDAGVRAVCVPATPRAYVHATEEGWLSSLVRAGVVVAAPTSGFAGGEEGTTLGPGERGLATAGVGESIPVDAELRLASPAVCAASAVMGRIAHPDEVMRAKREAV
ncbi:MAG: aconitase family protein, partial [Planctomycetota bacterium JB042]